MAWVTWVTWAFVALAAAVAVVAALASAGRLDATFEPPYEPAAPTPPPSADTSGHEAEDETGIEWSESAARPPNLDEDAATHPQSHPRTTGEPADGRHEAQDR